MDAKRHYSQICQGGQNSSPRETLYMSINMLHTHVYTHACLHTCVCTCLNKHRGTSCLFTRRWKRNLFACLMHDGMLKQKKAKQKKRKRRCIAATHRGAWMMGLRACHRSDVMTAVPHKHSKTKRFADMRCRAHGMHIVDAQATECGCLYWLGSIPGQA